MHHVRLYLMVKQLLQFLFFQNYNIFAYRDAYYDHKIFFFKCQSIKEFHNELIITLINLLISLSQFS